MAAFNYAGGGGGQQVATRRNMRREERVTVQGPVKEQQPDGMSHGGGGCCAGDCLVEIPDGGRKRVDRICTGCVLGWDLGEEFGRWYHLGRGQDQYPQCAVQGPHALTLCTVRNAQMHLLLQLL